MRARLVSLLVLMAVVAAEAPSASAEGKYTRRRRNRGEVTDTAPKLDRWAYIEDAAPEPRRLVLVVDTWLARHPRDPKLLPLVIALSFEGDGKPLPISPGRFELRWEGGEPVRALRDEEMLCETEPCRGTTGPSPVYADLRMLEARGAIPFDTPRATRIGVQFYSHPALDTYRHDATTLPAGSWFSTLAYFPVPKDFDKWEGLFDLSYVPEDGAPPEVTCRFRIQRDPALHSTAMRKARKDLRREEPRRKDR